ncbi:hypothetical protein PSm6_00270 [Pseudomonas solani]|uniref:HNH nuclease domain-containing protein n=1 Tax=Pseudomonas solani TaxID=2731552 RepID=A0ABN6BMJ4_9PSED|nr:HNH endonuclease [Pseudomonas solani]BCD83620.1 hypothetical protein PSm6_00270 [Pseudomonas solani]
MRLPTHEQILLAIYYDPETGLFKKPKGELTGGCSARGGYLSIYICGARFRAHRLAWFYMTGEWPKQEIDHINGDRKDNRFSNLRTCTHQQNNHNQPIRKTNTSGIKGVYWNKRQRKWRGQVCLNYHIHHTKGFDKIDEAEVAVRALREELHGEFANHGSHTTAR